MKNTLETRLGIFVALAMLVAFLILEMVGGLEHFKRGIRLRALFNTVQELKVGDPVKMGGVQIGRVERIAFTTVNTTTITSSTNNTSVTNTFPENKVLVTMKLDRAATVKTGSKATIQFAGLMGQNFVSLSFGSPNAPIATDTTPLDSTEQPDFSAVMAKLDNVATGVENMTKSFTGIKIDKLLGPMMDFFESNGPLIKGLLETNGPLLTATMSNLRSISSQISKGEGTVGKLIYDDSLHNSALAAVSNIESNLQSTSDEIKLAIADARKIVDEINAGQGTLGKLLKDETLYRDTTESMTNLKEILQKINRGQGSVGKLVNDESLYKNAKLSLQKLDKATEGLEDQGPLSVLGIAVGSLF
jgi:phospholipid/cholesterol/gamma-HCH transport system substrate-binding protein